MATDDIFHGDLGIIGGGVGGMEAARISALRGHAVILAERDSELGGMVRALANTPLTHEFGNIVDYLTAQMRKLKVDVRVCKKITASDVEAMNPDVVILATGSSTLGASSKFRDTLAGRKLFLFRYTGIGIPAVDKRFHQTRDVPHIDRRSQQHCI